MRPRYLSVFKVPSDSDNNCSYVLILMFITVKNSVTDKEVFTLEGLLLCSISRTSYFWDMA